MSDQISPERVTYLVAAALAPDDAKRRAAARKDLADALMDAPGADAFEVLLSTMLSDAYMTGWRDGAAGTRKKDRS